MTGLPDLPEHSPLGGSGASRWMKCPGSVSNSAGVVDEESDFAALGTAAHTLGEICLTHNSNPWTVIGHGISGGQIYHETAAPEDSILLDKDMADAVQVYLDAVRMWHPDRNQGNSWVEMPFYCPDLHEFYYGRSDFVYWDKEEDTLHVWDYKHGAGIIVEVKENPQGMYYAVGVLEQLDLWHKVDRITIHIAQPRGWHGDGPIRQWSISMDDLVTWLYDALLPAMNRAMVSRDTASGEHCRFCPARSRACPQLLGDMEELLAMTELAKKGTDPLTNEQVGQFMDLFDVAKIVNTAAGKTAFARLNAGKVVPGRKLSKARSNRKWKDGAEIAIVKKFGKSAMTEPALKSPAQIEAMPEGEAEAARWAFKPDAGLTVVKDSDTRPAVNKDTKSLFKPVKKGAKK